MYEVNGIEIEMVYFIHHDADAILSFIISLEPITLGYHTHTERINFIALIHAKARPCRKPLLHTHASSMRDWPG